MILRSISICCLDISLSSGLWLSLKSCPLSSISARFREHSKSWITFFFPPLKYYIAFCASSFCSGQAILCCKNFCTIIHLEEKLGMYFAFLNAFPTVYTPRGKGYFVPFCIVMRGRNMALNIDIFLNAYVIEYCCTCQTSIHVYFSPIVMPLQAR